MELLRRAAQQGGQRGRLAASVRCAHSWRKSPVTSALYRWKALACVRPTYQAVHHRSMNKAPVEGPAISALDEIPWALALGDAQAYPFQFRFRRFPIGFPRAGYPVRLNIFWTMNSPHASGLALPEDIELMQNFEDRLVSATEPHAAVLAMVMTGRGEREFVFFAQSAEEFMRRLGSMPQEATRYPIRIHAADDPCWDYFENEVRAATKV